MAEEPQPSNVTEGADAPDVVPANAEDRKAAAAMSSLDTRGEDETKPKKDVDMKAVQEAMKNLETGTQPQGKATAVESSKKKEEAPKKPLVKVDAADVTLIVSIEIFSPSPRLDARISLLFDELTGSRASNLI